MAGAANAATMKREARMGAATIRTAAVESE